MLEKIISIIIPIYGIFMAFVRDDCKDLLPWSLFSIIFYLSAIVNIELFIAGMISLIITAFIKN